VDGSKILAYAEFGKGILSLTTVRANTRGVYVSGYATDALEPLLKPVPGLMRDYPLRREVKLIEEGKWIEAVGEDTSKPDTIPEKGHSQLGRYGAPCVLRLSSDGSLIRKIEETDPMSGPDNRMNGAVADRGIGSIALDGEDLLFSSLSDGGYSGVIHFSGTIFRVDEKTKAAKATMKTGPCFWTVGLTPLPRKHVLAFGRCNLIAEKPAGAWQPFVAEENHQAWLRVYGPDLKVLFSSALRWVVPYAIIPLSGARYLLVGTSKGMLNLVKILEDKKYKVTDEPNPGVAPAKNTLFEKPPGGNDGNFMIVRWSEPETGPLTQP
jgi:hypothetical protein